MAFSVFSALRRVVGNPDVAIDLGTANTRLYARGRGLVAEEPSLVAIDAATGSVEAIGARAVRLADNDASKRCIAPLQAGVVSDVNAAAMLLEPLLRRARGGVGLMRPRVLVCAPTDATEEERNALVEATQRAGASTVVLAPEPLAAAIGAGLDVSSPYAQMLVDIGDGVTDIAVVRAGQLVMTSAVRTACSDLHAAVRAAVSTRSGILLYPREAERLTLEMGATRSCIPKSSCRATGIDRHTGREAHIDVSGREVCEAIDPVIGVIVDSIRTAVNDLPVTTACEIIESGICLTGGGARLRGLAALIHEATAVTAQPSSDPMRAVINGARQMLAVAAMTGLWVN